LYNIYLTYKIEYRIHETGERKGEPGNQDNRMQVIRIIVNQGKNLPDALIT